VFAGTSGDGVGMEVKLNGDGVANGVEMEAAATDGDVYVCVNFVLFIQLFVQRWPRLSVSTFCINLNDCRSLV